MRSWCHGQKIALGPDCTLYLALCQWYIIEFKCDFLMLNETWYMTCPWLHIIGSWQIQSKTCENEVEKLIFKFINMLKELLWIAIAYWQIRTSHMPYHSISIYQVKFNLLHFIFCWSCELNSKQADLNDVWSMALPLIASCHLPLHGFKFLTGHERKLPVALGWVVFFARYSRFLQQLQLASHDLAAV